MATKQSSSSAENGRPLVIVESPAKAKTISKFLGSEFDVRASVGHVADLPSKGLAVDVDDGFKPTYELTDRGRQVVKELRIALKEASELYLATDEDREGEAISWHLLQHLKPKVPVKRMVFHEITRGAIDHAVENPREIDDGLVDAAETRRILDRLYGYEVSPILWRKVNRGLSAGRVQSPSIRLIVERERERIFVDYLGKNRTVVRVRFNPDKYVDPATGKKMPSCFRKSGEKDLVSLDPKQAKQWKHRCDALIAWVRSMLDPTCDTYCETIPPREPGRPLFSQELFYDNPMTEKAKREKIEVMQRAQHAKKTQGGD